MDDFIDKREHPRSEVRWPISVSMEGSTIDGETMDISVSGISIYCDDPLPLNQTFQISIMPPDQPAIEVAGRVVWSDCYGIDEETTFGMGVCLVEISDEDRDRFNELVSVLLQ